MNLIDLKHLYLVDAFFLALIQDSNSLWFVNLNALIAVKYSLMLSFENRNEA